MDACEPLHQRMYARIHLYTRLYSHTLQLPCARRVPLTKAQGRGLPGPTTVTFPQRILLILMDKRTQLKQKSSADDRAQTSAREKAEGDRLTPGKVECGRILGVEGCWYRRAVQI